MKRVVEVLKEKFGNRIQGSHQETVRELQIKIAKEVVIPAARFLVETLEMRFLFLFGSDARNISGCFHLHYVFSYHHVDQFIILIVEVRGEDLTFPSLAPYLPQANWQEREIQDLFGLIAKGHPDPRRLVLHEDWPEGLYPFRKDFIQNKKVPRVNGEYVFDRVEGDGVFEIPVGPVHAGIIEPGHFRFSSAGESILKLEIRHFYTHKGTEKLGEGKDSSHLLCLAERISGDNSVAHATAAAQALETLCGFQIPPRAQFLRVVLLELERIYNHLADVGGVVLDVAFGFGAAQLARVKEQLMRLNERLTGSRLLRGMIVFGGVRNDISDLDKKYLIQEIGKIKVDFDQTIQILWNVSSLMDRIQKTGIIKKEIVEALGGTGPIARASGVDRDFRRDHPYAAYQELLFMVPVFREGDVESRIKVKMQEVYESFKLIYEAVTGMPEGISIVETVPLKPLRSALGYVESPRGECFHWIATDRDGRIARWKIQSPSFANWPLIEYAVLENIVPDFPVINKSMNLSYSGNDR
ncbi:MAG: NADH-quinone oxidoreductase subunit C [Candidatus Omnitrophica bacterium]|nr:NADH-quinone oxidoreductase subunit C [Candidatus Omnitrophota bacterium]